MSIKTTLTLLLALAAAGCSAAIPTKELQNARKAYDEARYSAAKDLVPADVLNAKQALERAERAFAEDPGSFKEKSYAYVAHRKASLAVARAGQAQAQQDAERADEQYKELQDELRRQAQKEAEATAEALRENQRNLERVQGELSNQGEKLSEAAQALKAKEEELARRQQELEQRKKELEQRNAELEKERLARIEAEKKAAAALKSLEEIAKVQEEQRGMVITLDGAVLFATGKSDLLPIAQQKLARVAQVLQEQDESKKIVVEGHTDSRGTDANNLKLSQARAESVRSYMVSQGVKPGRISAVGKGESQPIASNETPEGRANNRRVEIVVN